MTILFAGAFNQQSAVKYFRFAGYEPSDSALSLIFSGQPSAPDGIDRLAFVDAPDGSGDTVVRLHLHKDDPIGAFSASSTRTQLAYRLLQAQTEPEAQLQTSLWYRFRYWLPDDFGVWGSTTRPLALWQLHETRDGSSSARAFTADAGTDVLTFQAGCIWPAGTKVEVRSTGTLPAPLTAGAVYYVLNPATADETIQLSLTVGGAAINITSAGSGTHTMLDYPETPPLIASCYGDRITYTHQSEGGVQTLVAGNRLQRGRVESIVVNARWDWTSSGFIRVWHNGNKVYERTGQPSAFNDDTSRGGNGVYPVMCLYAPIGWSQAVGVPDSFSAYFWDVEIGDSTYLTFDSFMQALGSADRELEGFVTRGVSL